MIDVRDRERLPLLWSFAYFFTLLCGYFVLRPIREEMGIAGGVKKLPWMFTATFVAMLVVVPLYSAVVSRYPRRRLVPIVNRFFLLNLAAFFLLLTTGVADRAWVARAFFVWVSVYNLFVVSVFWSFMADVFGSEQGKRLFGFIAAGGTAGALAGPALTGLLAPWLGPERLLLVAAVLLEASVWCVRGLLRAPPSRAPGDVPAADPNAAIGGGAFAAFGLIARSPYLAGITLQTVLFTTTSTFLYLEQQALIEARIADPARRTALFAWMDLGGNLLTLGLQTFVTGRVLSGLGLRFSLGVVPVVTGLGFLALLASPALWLLLMVQGVRRSLHHAIDRPAREVLFTRVEPAEKYKAKSFIDTVVYRGGDAGSAWAHRGMASLGSGLATLALVTIPLCAMWLALAARLARRHEEKA